MRLLISYIRAGIFSITQNITYASFFVIGTALTFIFVVITLQMMFLIVYNPHPFVNAGRTIHVATLVDKNGAEEGLPLQDLYSLHSQIQGVELYSISNQENTHAEINQKVRQASVNFVDHNYFVVNEFVFWDGRGLNLDDISNRNQYAVITKDMANKYYNKDAIGKKISIQNQDYQIVGVIENYSSLSNPYEKSNIWIPYIFNKFVPSFNEYYEVDFLFSEDIPTYQAKENLAHALSLYFNVKNINIDINEKDLLTIQDVKENQFGKGKFAYGAALLILFLLAIPALNLMTLNSANIYNRLPEMALRRAIGSGKVLSFMQIMIENFILVCCGLILSMVLVFPVISIIESKFFESTSSVAFLTRSSISFPVIIVAILLSVLFTILVAAIPAYNMLRKNIAHILNETAS